MAAAGGKFIAITNILSNLEEDIGKAYSRILGDTPTLDANAFQKENFWKNFIAATKLISHEATKFSIMFNQPPFPSKEDCQVVSDKMGSICFSFIAVYFTLPKTKGKLLHNEIRNYVLSILQGLKELCAAAANQRQDTSHRSGHGTNPSFSHSQLKRIGNIWEKCEEVENLPKDNKDALVALCRGEHDIVQDACQELMDALEKDDDDSSDEFFVPRLNGLSEPNSSWTESDRRVLLPCSGLIKATKACLKKTLSAVSERGNGEDEHNISELDGIADIVKTCSSIVDDFVLSLYPPMNHTAVKDQAAVVRNTSKNLLSSVKIYHFCTDADEEWIKFLDKAIDHNWVRINDLALAE